MTFTFSVNNPSRRGDFFDALSSEAITYSICDGDQEIRDADGDETVRKLFDFVNFGCDGFTLGVFPRQLVAGEARCGADLFGSGQFEKVYPAFDAGSERRE